MPAGAILGEQGRVQAESTEPGLGTHDFTKVECFGRPRLVQDWAIQAKNSRVLVRFLGVLSKGHADCTALGNRGGCLSHGSLGESYQELTFTYEPGGCYLGPVLMGRGWEVGVRVSANSGLLQCHTKWMVRQQSYGLIYYLHSHLTHLAVSRKI